MYVYIYIYIFIYIYLCIYIFTSAGKCGSSVPRSHAARDSSNSRHQSCSRSAAGCGVPLPRAAVQKVRGALG